MLLWIPSLALIDSADNRVKLQWIAIMLLGSNAVVGVMPSFAQSFFDRPPTRVMIHNPESTEGLRNRTTITVVVPEDAGNALGEVCCGSCPILISGIGAAWNLGFISAIIPFVGKEQKDWPQLLSQIPTRS